MKYPKVALLAPITHTMPPVTYGPWELVVYNLQEELVKLGVDVTVFTTGDANISANQRSFFDHPTGEDDQDYTTAALTIHTIKALKEAKNYDIIHTHLNIQPVLYSELIDTPVVATLHGAAIEKNNALYYQFLKKNILAVRWIETRRLSV
jgi:glycosyltransferase involved in cell wall biosynthesis